jgi:hypothetical protein
MTSYILFVFADFEDHEDIQYFCTEHFAGISEVGVKYVIENTGNCIIIFDTEKSKEDLHKSISDLLSLDQIRFYFLFERSSILSAHLPETLKDFIFKPIETPSETLEIVRKPEPNLDLDDILDKIETFGINSLTEDEKNFLDTFGK